MINIRCDESHRVVVLEPSGALSSDDFAAVAEQVDPLIDQHGSLNGLVIHVASFPGWDSFSGLVSHIRFVKDHHRHIGKVALCTDSPVGAVAERFASHFVSADIRTFPYADLAAAEAWVAG
jgi:hypothetical protein